MQVAVFGTRAYDRVHLAAANAGRHELIFLEPDLDEKTALLAQGRGAVCLFVNDRADSRVLDMPVVRVPAYSPHAVAEFTIGLLLALDRKIHRAWACTRENNFALDGLVGRNLHGRVAGVIGTGRIGALVARSLRAGFGCEVLAHDLVEDPELVALGVRYVERDALLAQSEIISLHCPLMPETRHLIDAAVLAGARKGLLISIPAVAG